MPKPPNPSIIPPSGPPRKPRAVARKPAVAQVKATSALSLLAPMLAVLAAILPAVVDWQIERQGIVLLLLLGALGFALAKIPHYSFSWKVEPGTTWAALKQTIATMRTIVTIVLVVLILAILASSRTIVGQLPDEIARLVEPAINSDQRDVMALRLQQSPERRDGMNMYFGRLESAGNKQTRSPGVPEIGKQSPETTATNVIYVVSAPTIMRGLLERTLLPTFFQFAWIGAILAGLFICGIFFMELMSNILWEYQIRTKAAAKV